MMTVSVNQTTNSSDHWAKLFSAQRLGSHKKAPGEDSARSSFHKDYDRLVFSHSFRQLNQKTQVHPLTNQLGIHTRLTHSLEVSCIGRSLGVMAAYLTVSRPLMSVSLSKQLALPMILATHRLVMPESTPFVTGLCILTVSKSCKI